MMSRRTTGVGSAERPAPRFVVRASKFRRLLGRSFQVLLVVDLARRIEERQAQRGANVGASILSFPKISSLLVVMQ